MKFTELEAILFKNGIHFVHLSPSEEACRIAELDFESSIYDHGLEYLKRDTDYSNFAFGVCTMMGRSFNHVPVLLLEEGCSGVALEHALMIPSCINGVGPMVIK